MAKKRNQNTQLGFADSVVPVFLFFLLRFLSAFSISHWNCFSSLFLAPLCSWSFLQFCSLNLSECPWYFSSWHDSYFPCRLQWLVESADPICQKHRKLLLKLVYQMPVQGRRTTLLDAITQAHSTAHMEQNATRIIPLPNFLLAGTCFFIHFWTFTFSTVSQSLFWVFLWTYFFFVATKYRWHLGLCLGLIFIQSLVVLDLTHSFLGILGVLLDLYFFTW